MRLTRRIADGGASLEKHCKASIAQSIYNPRGVASRLRPILFAAWITTMSVFTQSAVVPLVAASSVRTLKTSLRRHSIDVVGMSSDRILDL